MTTKRDETRFAVLHDGMYYAGREGWAFEVGQATRFTRRSSAETIKRVLSRQLRGVKVVKA